MAIQHDRRGIRCRTNGLTCFPRHGGIIPPTFILRATTEKFKLEKPNSTFFPTRESNPGPHAQQSRMRPRDQLNNNPCTEVTWYLIWTVPVALANKFHSYLKIRVTILRGYVSEEVLWISFTRHRFFWILRQFSFPTILSTVSYHCNSPRP